MKVLKSVAFALALCLFVAVPAKAQFHFGIQGGIVANDLKFNEHVFDASNRIGFTGGITTQFDLPVIAFQASLMYVQRTSEVKTSDASSAQIDNAVYDKDYLTLPIHLKANIGLPGLSGLLRLFVFTGPSFSFLLSNKEYQLSDGSTIKSNKGDIDWDFGVGADIVKHLQLTVGYGIGVTKAAHFFKVGESYQRDVRQNSWTITLGYLF